jgi:hypothetical protein
MKYEQPLRSFTDNIVDMERNLRKSATRVNHYNNPTREKEERKKARTI